MREKAVTGPGCPSSAIYFWVPMLIFVIGIEQCVSNYQLSSERLQILSLPQNEAPAEF
jgi:hypothetical protein